MISNFETHQRIVSSCANEAELHSNWFTLLATAYFDVAAGEIQHERRGPKGIIDVKLVKNGRCQIAVELKSPDVTDLDSHFLQAHQYAFSFNYYRDGKVVHPLGILTNGKKAVVFDGSLPKAQALASKEVINLETSEGFEAFCKILARIHEGSLGHDRLHRAPYIDTRPAGILDDKLQEEFRVFLRKIWDVVEEPVLAFDYWVQLFLVAVLRDHGIIPNSVLKELERTGNIRGITVELNRLLNENFIPLNNEWSDLIWEIYGETGKFCTRLNLLHADTLGYAYESVLKQVHGDNANSTSVYTPQELAEELIAKLSPRVDDTVLDSAAGSGTLLCVAAELAWASVPKNLIDQEKLKRFFEEHLIAVDRDIYALKCCKAMLLCTFIKILDKDPQELGERWTLPKLGQIHHSNLFDAKLDKTVSLVVGNPPWGNIDAPNNRVGLRTQDRSMFRGSFRNIYSDDSDVCIYVVRYMLSGSMFRLSRDFRGGFLLKQQVLRNTSHEKFRTWAGEENFRFVDHGSRQRFPHSPASLVAECLIGVRQDSPFITKVSADQSNGAVLNEGLPISDLIVAANGFQPSNKGVYVSLAQRITSTTARERWVKALYPRAPSLVPVIWDSESAEEIMFVPRGVAFPHSIVRLTADERSELEGRAQVAADFPYSWRGCEKLEAYGEDLETPRIFMPREPARGERVRAAIDLEGSGIGTSGHSVWLKRPEVPDGLFRCLIAWVSSKYFMQQLEIAEINLRAHGFSFEPNEVNKLRVPDWVLTEQTLNWTNSVLEKGTVTAADYTALDALASQQGLTQLSASISEMRESRRQIEDLLAKAAEAKKSKKKKVAKKVQRKKVRSRRA